MRKPLLACVIFYVKAQECGDQYGGDPFQLRNCVFEKSQKKCAFDFKQCRNSRKCRYGLQVDTIGCVKSSCECNENPIGQVHFGDIVGYRILL